MPLQSLPWAVLIHPGFGSPTAEAYRQYAARHCQGEEGPAIPLKLATGKTYELRPRNDLEPAVEEKFLWVRVARHWLAQQPGVLAARMSGSGSTVFGLWPKESEAQAVADRAKSYFGETAWIRATRLMGSAVAT